MDGDGGGITVERWRPSRGRALLGSLAYPIFRLLNRPRLAWVGRAAYDIALRANGIAINFPGRHGLSVGEEAFLARIAPGLAGATVMDVGANAGHYAAELRRLAPSARVLAVEPHPRTFAAMDQKLAGQRIETFRLAFGAEPGQFELYDFADADGSTQASLNRDAVALYGDRVVAHPVTVTTIDGFLAEQGIERLGLLKVDTEGHDLQVLLGAREAIRARRIAVLQFEFIPANIATRTTMRDFFEALPGYRIARLCLNGAELPLEYSVKHCEIPVTQNLIARPA